MNLKAKRMLSKLLCLAMVLGLVPTLALPALAAEEQAGDGNVTYAVQLAAEQFSADKFTSDSSVPVAANEASATVYARLTYTVEGSTETYVVTDSTYTISASSDSTVVIVPESIDNSDGVGTINLTVDPPAAKTEVKLTVTFMNGNTVIKSGTITVSVEAKPYPTPINLTGIEDAVGTVTDGKFTVNSEKACVVLYSTDTLDETKVKNGEGTQWNVINPSDMPDQPENTRTFDLSSITNAKTVVVALKGDVTFDGKINSLDISVLADHILEVQGKTMADIIKLVADVNGDSDINSLDISLYADDILEVKKLEW